MRPDRVFDQHLQHERTSLAWERTAFSGLVVGVLMARVGAGIHVAVGGLGILQVCLSAGVLLWSGKHYEDLHGVLRAGASPTRPTAARIVGLGTTITTAVATVLTIVHVAVDR